MLVPFLETQDSFPLEFAEIANVETECQHQRQISENNVVLEIQQK